MSDDAEEAEGPCIEILTTLNPMLYSPRQIYRAMYFAAILGASEFHLFERPRP